MKYRALGVLVFAGLIALSPGCCFMDPNLIYKMPPVGSNYADWAGKASAGGEILFVNNYGLEGGKLRPGLTHVRNGQAWSIGTSFNDAALPFLCAPLYYLRVPVGTIMFRASAGDLDIDIPIEVKENQIYIVPIALALTGSSVDREYDKTTFSTYGTLRVHPTVSLPSYFVPDAEAALREALASDEPGVRYRACRELEKLRVVNRLDKTTIERLTSLAKDDPSGLARKGAEIALGLNKNAWGRSGRQE